MAKSHTDGKSLRLLLQQAIKQQQSGNLKAAERKYRSILKAEPNHTDALQFLAALLQESGKDSAALHFMQKALGIAADNPILNSNQAEIFRLQGNVDAAETYARRALALNPALVDPLVILASVYQSRKNYDKAEAYYFKALNLTPDDMSVRNELGNVYSAMGRFREAQKQYQLILEKNDNFHDCRMNLADTLVELGENESAISHYRILLQHQPNNSSLLLKLARSMISIQSDEVPLILNRALKLDKNNAEAHCLLGIHAQTMGDFQQAGAYFEAAIVLNPDFYDPWYRLSLNKGYSPTNDQLESLAKKFDQLRANNPDDPQLIALGFSLGSFYERQNDFDRAFKCYQTANRIKTLQQPFDRQKHDAQIDNVIDIFDADFFEARQDWGNPASLPVFIIGMPRSGTTLVEQILSSHPSVYGGGELQLMLNLLKELKPDSENTVSSHAQQFAQFSQNHIQDMSDQYIRDLQALSPEATFISDKLPGNYFRLGIIFLLFPQATIIHCERNPMDTCWSCFQQNFESGLKFTNDLEHLGYAYKGYQRLMKHWHQLKPGRILNIKYESLLQDPETESQRLLEHCGLDWSPEVLDFYRQSRPVSTASLWQVRQPLYQSSIDRWKKYEVFLQPLSAILDA